MFMLGTLINCTAKRTSGIALLSESIFEHIFLSLENEKKSLEIRAV